jgi:hypothetical protein
MRFTFHGDQWFDAARHARVHIGGAEVNGIGEQLRRHADLVLSRCQYRQHWRDLPTVVPGLRDEGSDDEHAVSVNRHLAVSIDEKQLQHEVQQLMALAESEDRKNVPMAWMKPRIPTPFVSLCSSTFYRTVTLFFSAKSDTLLGRHRPG